MEYILKNGEKVQSEPIGKSSVIIGEQYGYLTVCDRGPAPKSGRGATVICKCKCGNYTLNKLNELRNGSTHSCGCYGREQAAIRCKEIGKKQHYKDYTQEINPYYEFIEPGEYKESLASIIWKIKCKSCGKEYYEVPSQLISDKRRKGNNPCDCWQFKSKGMLKIENILMNNNISFEKEKQFDTCLSPKGNPMKFDYYLPQYNLIIEYDGEQHFKPTTFGGSLDGEIRLTTQKEYDKIKNDWCKENKIELRRINFTQYNDIDLDMLIGGIDDKESL